MIVMGIDTSGYVNTVGVVNDDEVLADATFEAKTDSLEQIVANVESTLRAAGITLEGVQGIGVGLGPGSWTGIRVGVTAGKLLAFSTGKPVVGVPTLQALAYSARSKASLICAVISAGTGDTVYAGFYRSGDDSVTRIGDYFVGGIKELLKSVSEPVLFVNTGLPSGGQLSDIKLESVKPDVKTVTTVPNGAVVARLAAQRLQCGESDDVLALTPLYLKESTARAFVNKYRKKGQSIKK